MTRARLTLLLLLLSALLLLPACAPLEPVNGCLLAAANRREVLRARAYLHPAIPACLLAIEYPGRSMGHAALVYRLDPEGWCVYDDTFGTRALPGFAFGQFPDPVAAARTAFPGVCISDARWMAPAR